MSRYYRLTLAAIIVISFILGDISPAAAAAALTVTPITWNVIGLDSNNVNVGPNNFPVGTRACNPVANTVTFTDVEADFLWQSGGTQTTDTYIRLRPGSLDPIQPSPQVDLDPGECYDFYFEVEIERDSVSYDETRRFRIDVTYDDPEIAGIQTVSTPTPREVYVEHLVSQNRNEVLDVKLDGVSIAAGGTMNLSVGSTYTITLVAETAPNGYEQVESFINFPNTIFQILAVSTTYTHDEGTDPDANTKLYADGCGWVNDPTDPNYRSCSGVGKYGDAVTIDYTVKIIGGGGTNQTLNTLIYDFSGSSYHYNSDFSTSYRVASITDPSACTQQTITQWTFTGDVTTPSTGTGTLSAGSGVALAGFPDVGPNPPAASYNGWPTSPPRGATDYIEFAVSTLGSTAIHFNFGRNRSTQGPVSLDVLYSTDGVNFSQHGAAQSVGTAWDSSNNDLSSIAALNNNSNAKFRIYGYSAGNANGTLRLDNVTVTGCALPASINLDKTGVVDQTVVAPTNETNVGDQINYTMVITNNGGGNLTGITLSDTKAASLTCVPALSGLSLAPGESTTCTGSYTLTQADFDAGEVANTATADSNETSSVTDSTAQTLPQNPALTLAKSPAPATYTAAGETITYTYTLTNSGNVTLTAPYAVTDDKVASLDCSAAASPLAPGDSTTCSGSYTTTAADVTAGSVTNTASATATFDSNPVASNTANATINLAALSITKEVSASAGGPWSDTVNVNVGDTVYYRITVDNTGSANLTGVTVDDGLAGCTLSGPSGDTGNDGVLGVGETWTYACSVALSADTTNTASVDADDSGGNTLTRSDDATVNVINPDINVVKSVDNAIIYTGGSVTYTYTVTNPGDDPLSSVSVSDNACAPVAYAGGDDGDSVLEVGETWTFTCTTALAADTINTAAAEGADSNGGTVSDADTESVNVINPSLSVAKAASSALINSGDTVTYTITVANTGDDPLTNVSVDDGLAGCALSGPSGDTGGDSVLGVGETWTYTCSVALTADTTNTAGVTAEDSLGNTVSGSEDEFVDVRPTVTLDKSPNPASLPEPGGVFTYTLTITNTSSETVTITSLSDTNPLSAACNALVGATLGAGAFASCTYTVSQTDVGAYPNTADVEVQDDENNTATDSASASVAVTDELPGISVDKSADPTSLNEPGGNVTFTVAVTNSSVESVTLTALSDDVYGDLDGVGTCAVPQTIAAGNTYTCAFTGALSGDPGDAQTDTVTATAEDNEGNSTSDTDVATVTIVDVPSSIAVTKTADPTSLDEPGGSVTFTVRVDNTSAVDSVTITSLTDDVHGNLNGQGTCILPQTIAAGGFYECSFTATVSGDAGDTETDTATAAGTDDDGNAVVAEDGATVTINDLPSGIAVTKTANPTVVVAPGGSVTFTVRLDNTSAVDSVTITSLIDDTHGDLNGQGACSVPQTIAAGDFYECTFTATVSGNAGDSETDTVYADGSDDDGFAVEASDDATVNITSQQADLSLNKTVDNPNPLYGTNVTFTITVANAGPDSASGVQVSDLLPSGYSYVSSNASQGTYNSGTGVWNIGNLAVGQDETLEITAAVLVGGSYTNTAEVNASDQVDPDSTPNNGNPGEDDQDGASVSPTQGDPSGLSKSVLETNQAFTTGTEVAIGEIVTYVVEVTIPPGVFPNARLVDTLDRGLAFVACDSIDAASLTATAQGGDFALICSNPTVDANGSLEPVDVDRRVTFDFGTLTNASGSDKALTLTYRAVVLNSAENVDGVNLANSAAFSSDVGALDPAAATVQIVEPHLSIDKSADILFVAEGSEVTFTLKVRHTATSQANAYEVVVEDTLPTGLDYVSGSLDCTGGAQDPDVNCSYNPATRTIRAQWSVFVLGGGDGQIRFRVIGSDDLPSGGSVTNTASVAWTSLPGLVAAPQTGNQFSTERFYDPGDPINVYSADDALDLTPLGGGGGGGGGDDDDDEGGGGGGLGGFLIPVTGFAPGRITDLTGIPRSFYTSTGGVRIEIPALKLNTSVAGVKLEKGNWNATWLWDQAGWLQGTAFPTWSGNSVITAHVVRSDGQPGPFARLNKLKPGDQVVVYAYGYRYIYVVRSTRYVAPDDISILRHETKPWLTLVTCDDYDEASGTYLSRVVVRAELAQVEPVKK